MRDGRSSDLLPPSTHEICAEEEAPWTPTTAGAWDGSSPKATSMVAGSTAASKKPTSPRGAATSVLSLADVSNGFNAARRDAILAAAASMWPEQLEIFLAYYGEDSIVIFIYTDEDGTQHVSIIRGHEGTRMGCVLGSIGFDMAEHHYIFQFLRDEFPNVLFRALTDDQIRALVG